MKTKKLLALLLMLSMLVSLLPLSAAAEDEIPDGFYLVGTMNEWKPSAEYLFSKNPESEGEYFLITPLSSGAEFKAAWVEHGGIKNYYPDQGGNYVVPSGQAGDNMKVYFRPSYFGEWNGHFYVAHTYAITLASGIGNGTVTPSQTIGAENDTIRIDVKAAEGYELSTLTYNEIDCKESRSFRMPAAAVVIDASFKKSEYTITKAACTHGSVGVSGDKTAATMGETITLTNTPDAGYSFAAYAVTKEGGGTVVVSENGEFTMPAGNVTVSASFTENVYAVTTSFDNSKGSIDAPESAATGASVSFTVTPAEGFLLDGAPTVKKGETSVPVYPVEGEEGVYSFTMPAGAVTISAAFMQQINDGYYLIGEISSLGTNGWTINDIDKSTLFIKNDACTASEYEYILTSLTLNDGDVLKIVLVQGNAIREWYPEGGESTNYKVNSAHAGLRIIYFRPTGRVSDNYWSDLDPDSWDYFYIAPRNQQLEDKHYYLIGPDWTATDIKDNEEFFANPGSSEGIEEYILLTSRSAGSKVKVARVDLQHAITAWYPDGFTNEHTISAEQAGDIVVYFRPNGNPGAWGPAFDDYFYIAHGPYITVVPSDHGSAAVSAEVSSYIRDSSVYPGEGDPTYYRKRFTFAGAPLTLSAEPDPGYELDTFTVKDDDGNTIHSATGSYSMPGGNISVSATFRQLEYTAAPR